ncbi:hypothetical protein AC578_10975 [Pseudocercospora eumusae]|uniref:Uncharacterized protein n=1 Tax=Pseudocercospora eumusae TaxID=321146 RepID=A0A139HSK4_9PEZI|nr:hypothetical protein AC578_10975 [Pseudocercospora eumusae]
MFSLIQDPKRLRQEDLSTGVRIEDLTQPLNRTYHMAIMTPEILLGDASTAESGTSCQDFVGRIPVIISIARCTVGKSAFHRAPRSLKPLTRRKVAHSLVEVAQSVGRSQEKKSCVFGFSVLRAALPLLLFLLFHSVWRRSFSSSPSIRLADLQHLFRQDWEGGHGGHRELEPGADLRASQYIHLIKASIIIWLTAIYIRTMIRASNALQTLAKVLHCLCRCSAPHAAIVRSCLLPELMSSWCLKSCLKSRSSSIPKT